MEQGVLHFDDERTIQEAFEDFDRLHPEVYQYLVKLTFEVYTRGYRHYGIGALWERLRWHFQIEKDIEDFKLNNNFRSRYARKLMAAYPQELDDFFEVRELRAE